jgi:uncharacterized protein
MQNKLMLSQARTVYVGLLEQTLQEVVGKLAALPEVERFSLFGSFAKGKADLFTDLDILVVMDTDEPFSKRLRTLYGRLAVPVDMDLLCYTPQELRDMQDRPFLKRIRQEEVVLYEKKRP